MDPKDVFSSSLPPKTSSKEVPQSLVRSTWEFLNKLDTLLVGISKGKAVATELSVLSEDALAEFLHFMPFEKPTVANKQDAWTLFGHRVRRSKWVSSYAGGPWCPKWGFVEAIHPVVFCVVHATQKTPTECPN